MSVLQKKNCFFKINYNWRETGNWRMKEEDEGTMGTVIERKI